MNLGCRLGKGESARRSVNECHDVSVSYPTQVTGWGNESPQDRHGVQSDAIFPRRVQSDAIFPDETPAAWIVIWPPGSLTEFKPAPAVVVC